MKSYRVNLTTVDADSVMFVWKNRMPLAMSWSFYNKMKNVVSAMISTETPMYVFYKVGANKGLASWVDLQKATAEGKRYGITTPTIDEDGNVTRDVVQKCCDNAFASENFLASQVDKLIIPTIVFFDEDGFEYWVAPNDGDVAFVTKETLKCSGGTNTEVQISQGSMLNPELDFSMRHMMSDIRLKFRDGYPTNALATLNSLLVPLVRDNHDDKTAWIRDGLEMCSVMRNDFLQQKVETDKWSLPGTILVKNAILKSDVDSIADLTAEAKSKTYYDMRPQLGWFWFTHNGCIYGYNTKEEKIRFATIQSVASGTPVWTAKTLPKLRVGATDVTIDNRYIIIPMNDEGRFAIFMQDNAGSITADYKFAITNDNFNSVNLYEFNGSVPLFNTAKCSVYPFKIPGSNEVFLIQTSDDKKGLYRLVYDTTNVANPISVVEVEDGEVIAGQLKFVAGDFNDLVNRVYDIKTTNLRFIDYGMNMGERSAYLYSESESPNGKTFNVFGRDTDRELNWTKIKMFDNTTTVTSFNTLSRFNLPQNLDSLELSDFIVDIDSKNFVEVRLDYNAQSFNLNRYFLTIIYATANKTIVERRFAWLVKDPTTGEDVLVTHKVAFADLSVDTVNNPSFANGKFVRIGENDYVSICNAGWVSSYSTVHAGKTDDAAIRYATLRKLSFEFNGDDISVATSFVTFNTTSINPMCAIRLGDIRPDTATNTPAVMGYIMQRLFWDKASSTLLMVGDYLQNFVTEDNDAVPFCPFIYAYSVEHETRVNKFYDMRVKMYRWKGIKASTQIKALYLFDEIGGKQTNMSEPPKRMYFPIEINPKAFMLLFCGIPILDGSVYVDPKDKHVIVCEDISRYVALVKAKDNFLKDSLNEFVYSNFTLINFTAEDSDKIAVMHTDWGYVPNYGGTEMKATFNTFNSHNEMILLNGIDHEYLINPKNLCEIIYPMSRYGLTELPQAGNKYNLAGLYNLKESSPKAVQRIQFCLIDK